METLQRGRQDVDDRRPNAQHILNKKMMNSALMAQSINELRAHVERILSCETNLSNVCFFSGYDFAHAFG